MSESLLLWVEIIFDLLYLGTIWVVVALMFKNKLNLTKKQPQSADYLCGVSFCWHSGIPVM